ncbi:hypothetical protein PV703_11440 [Streptomyces sp. ME01-24h]|nr:hypothetical protein [Streptomyces sp. ME01-24h]
MTRTAHARRALAALAIPAAVLALTAGACNPEKVGPAGKVTAKENKRWDCSGRCKARLWLTTRDTAGKTHRFEVSKATWRDCGIGEAYPACKP